MKFDQGGVSRVRRIRKLESSNNTVGKATAGMKTLGTRLDMQSTHAFL